MQKNEAQKQQSKNKIMANQTLKMILNASMALFANVLKKEFVKKPGHRQKQKKQGEGLKFHEAVKGASLDKLGFHGLIETWKLLFGPGPFMTLVCI